MTHTDKATETTSNLQGQVFGKISCKTKTHHHRLIQYQKLHLLLLQIRIEGPGTLPPVRHQTRISRVANTKPWKKGYKWQQLLKVSYIKIKSPTPHR